MSDKNPRSIRRTVTVNKRRVRWGALLLVVGIVGIMVVLVAPNPPDFLFFYFGLAIFWRLVIVYRAFKVSATNSRADTSPRPHGSWLDRSSKTQRSEAEADTGSAERSRPHRWENFWHEFSSIIDAEYEGSLLGSPRRVHAHSFEGWEILLDTYQVGGDRGGSHTVTRIRAPYFERRQLRFSITRRRRIDNLYQILVGAFYRMEQLRLGLPELDNNFIIKADDAQLVRNLLGEDLIRSLIQTPKGLKLLTLTEEVPAPPGVVATHRDVNVLFCRLDGINDLSELQSLFGLLAQTLDRMREMRVAEPTRDMVYSRWAAGVIKQGPHIVP